MGIVEVNKDFYNKLYRRKNPAISILHSLISFDQQSKSKINIKVIKGFFKEKFLKDLVVLDYGFGHGSLLLKYRRNHELYGCDISEEAVYNFPVVASFIGRKVLTATVDDYFSKYKDVCFDIITLSHIIEHVDDDFLLVNSLKTKLSDSGIMLINVPINEVWQDPKHVRKYSADSIKELADKCNLEIQSILEVDKLTSFFLIEEKVKNAGIFKLYTIKIARLFFAVTPLTITQVFERLFLKGHQMQQLIVLATAK